MNQNRIKTELFSPELVHGHTILDSDVTKPHIEGQITVDRMEIPRSIEDITASCKVLLKVLLKFAILRMSIKPASYQVATDGVVYDHEMLGL